MKILTIKYGICTLVDLMSNKCKSTQLAAKIAEEIITKLPDHEEGWPTPFR
jgi:hypothetical protein